MRRGKLFSAIILCGMVASCSNEELLDINPGQGQDVSSRPVIGNVTLNVNDASTRAYDDAGNWDWNGVTIGAALMDTYKGSGIGLDAYTLSNNTFTNYPYSRQESGTWSNDALMVEGNYFFYAPYNQAIQRNGLTHSVKTLQYAYDVVANPSLEMTETADIVRYQAVTDNQLFIGYHGFEAGDEETSVSLSMATAHANLGIQVVNAGSEKITIHKIVFKDANLKPDGQLIINGGADAKKVTDFKYYDEEGAIQSKTGYDSWDITDCFNAFAINAQTNMPNSFNPLNEFYVPTTSATAQDITIVYPNTQLAAGANAVVNMVLPVPAGGSFSGLGADVYTSKGVLTYDLSTGAVADGKVKEAIKESTHSAFGVRQLKTTAESDSKTYAYAWSNGGGLSTLNTLASNSLVLAFDEDADFQVPTDLTVSTTNELEYYLTNWYTGKNDNELGTSKIEKVNITINGSNVEMNQAIYNYLKGAKNSAVEVVAGKLIIPAGIAADAIMEVSTSSIGELVIAKDATQTISVSAVSASTPVEYTNAIVNNGTLNIAATGAHAATTTTNLTGVVTNNGTLNVNSKTTYGVSGNAFDNGGIMNVNADFTSSTSITNKGTLDVKAGTVTTAKLVNGADDDKALTATTSINAAQTAITEIENYGTLNINKNLTTQLVNKSWNVSTTATAFNFLNAQTTVAQGATLKLNAGSANNGTLTVKGNVNVEGNDVINAKVYSQNTDAELVIESTGYFQVMIGGQITNTSKVTNAGTIACSGTGKFINDAQGKLYIVGGTTLISENKANAEVICDEMEPTLMITTNAGDVSYVMDEDADLTKLHSLINKLTLNYGGDIDLTSIFEAPTTNGQVTADYTRIKKVALNASEATELTFAAGTQLSSLELKSTGKVKIACTKSNFVTAATGSIIQEGFAVENFTVKSGTNVEITSGTELYVQGTSPTATIEALVVVAGKFYAKAGGTYSEQDFVISSGGTSSPINWNATAVEWHLYN